MLEGNEAEGKIGKYGEYKVDVRPDGSFRIEAGGGLKDGLKGGAYVDGDVVDLLKMLADLTDTNLDNKAVQFIEDLLPDRKKEAPAEPEKSE